MTNENFNSSEPVSSNIKDIFFGMSIMGIMAMLSNSENTSESQIEAVEWFKSNESKAQTVQEWCDYQLTLLNTGEYTINFMTVDEFNTILNKLFTDNSEKSRGLAFTGMLASAQYEAGHIINSHLCKSLVNDFCENVLLVKSPDYTNLNKGQLFELVTGANLYYALLDFSSNPRMKNYFDKEFVEDSLKDIVENSQSLVKESLVNINNH